MRVVSHVEIFGILLVDASPTMAGGPCNHSRTPVDGSVLVVDALHPGLYDAIVVSSAVICAKGGRTGHMESLCRSRGIPVLRVDPAELDRLTGHVTIRLDRQSVVLGETAGPEGPPRDFPVTPADLRSICVVIADASDVRTTNAITPPVEEVGTFFVREEFVCLSAGLSPLDLLRSEPRAAEWYGAALGAQLCAIVDELLPGQRLVMRLLDLRSDDATKITTETEVHQETNPDLGLHGARALLQEPRYPHAFLALRQYVDKRLGRNPPHLSFAVPFVNDPDEYLRLRGHLGLPDDFPLSVFVETPAAVHSTSGFCAAGASELFVGTKDLVQFYLAADRSNHLVAPSYQTRHPAVEAALRHVVDAAGEAGTPVHVFALLNDMDHYVRQLPADGFMMCTAELRQLAQHRPPHLSLTPPRHRQPRHRPHPAGPEEAAS